MNESNSPLIALVDQNDKVTGYYNKLKVHEEGLLHRAFSVFIFNKKGEMLIHQRARHKYHSPSLWTNACCSHLLENMEMENCIHDRLLFEMGFDVPVKFQFSFTYRETFDNGLTEYETDHVYFGCWDGNPEVNPDEVANTRWITFNDLIVDINNNPENYTYWFKYILNNFESDLRKGLC